MRRFTRFPGAPWLAIGLAAGLLLAPAAAVGAAGLVRIVGSNGKKAQVTPAYQLQTSAAAPAQFRGFRELAVTPTCKVAFTAPANKAYVMTRATFNVYQNPTPGNANWIGLFSDASCTQIIVESNPAEVGAFNVPFEPGYGVKAGGSIYTMTLGNVRGEVYVHGYLVPKHAVPSTTSVLNLSGADLSENH